MNVRLLERGQLLFPTVRKDKDRPLSLGPVVTVTETGDAYRGFLGVKKICPP